MLRLQMLMLKFAGMVAGMVSLPALAECLDVPEQHAEVWLHLAAIWNLSMTNSRAQHHPVGSLGTDMTVLDMQVLVDTIAAVNKSHLPVQEEPPGLLAASI